MSFVFFLFFFFFFFASSNKKVPFYNCGKWNKSTTATKLIKRKYVWAKNTGAHLQAFLPQLGMAQHPPHQHTDHRKLRINDNSKTLQVYQTTHFWRRLVKVVSGKTVSFAINPECEGWRAFNHITVRFIKREITKAMA